MCGHTRRDKVRNEDIKARGESSLHSEQNAESEGELV